MYTVNVLSVYVEKIIPRCDGQIYDWHIPIDGGSQSVQNMFILKLDLDDLSNKDIYSLFKIRIYLSYWTLHFQSSYCRSFSAYV